MFNGKVLSLYYKTNGKALNNMKAQVGKYFFGRHRRCWGIWQWDSVGNGCASGTFIKDVFTYEDAVKEVYRLNGWGEPKYIKRVF